MNACAEMPGRWDFGRDPQQIDDRAYVAWAEEHGREPDECVLCGVLVEATDERGYCDGCAEDLASRAKAPLSAEDFSPAARIGDGEVPF